MKNKQLYLLYGLITLLLIIIAVLVTLHFQKPATPTMPVATAKDAVQQQHAEAVSSAMSTDEYGELGITHPDDPVETTANDQPSKGQENFADEVIALLEVSKTLSSQVDIEYHPDQMLQHNLAHHGLKPIKTAPALLKRHLSQIKQNLSAQLTEEWGRGRPDQVAQELEGWSDEHGVLTYRTAWGSDRGHCTWYVAIWNTASQQLEAEGFKPCFE